MVLGWYRHFSAKLSINSKRRGICVCAQLCLPLCSPKDCSPPGSSVHGISQARILEQVTISFSRGSSQPTDGTHVSQVFYIGSQVLYHQHHLGSPQRRGKWHQIRSVAQSCLTFCDPMNRSTPASLSITNSGSSLRLTSIKSVMPSSHLILCRPLLLLPPIPPSISLFQWVNSSHEVAKVLEFQL